MASYTVFLMEGDETLWSIVINDIEIVAGMLAAGTGILDDLNYTSIQSTTHIYSLDSNADVSQFRLINSVAEESIGQSMCDKFVCNEADICGVNSNRIKPGYFGIWMNSGIRFYYTLYAFRTPAFFQGIISMCGAFGVDFRNYIYGLPFDENGNQYALSGYTMIQYQTVEDVPDLDDIEDEEIRDENTIRSVNTDQDWFADTHNLLALAA